MGEAYGLSGSRVPKGGMRRSENVMSFIVNPLCYYVVSMSNPNGRILVVHNTTSKKEEVIWTTFKTISTFSLKFNKSI